MLLNVAWTGGGTADGRRIDSGMLAGDIRAVALIRGTRIAVIGARRAIRFLGIGGTGGAGAGAHLLRVAFAGAGATDRAGVPRRVLAGDVGAVTVIERAWVAVRRAECARHDTCSVARAGDAGPS